MAQRNPTHQGMDCPDCGKTLMAIPSGWWCRNIDHDTMALSEAPVQRDPKKGTTYREVPSLRNDSPGKNLWRTFELEAYRGE
jgi:hypothetical protein